MIRTNSTSTDDEPTSRYRAAIENIPFRLPKSAGSVLGVLLLLLIGSVPAAADQHCDTAFTSLLLVFEGILIGNGQIIMVILLVLGVVLWAASPVVPGQTAVGVAMIFIVFVSAIAFVAGIDVLTITFEQAGVAERSCSDLTTS